MIKRYFSLFTLILILINLSVPMATLAAPKREVTMTSFGIGSGFYTMCAAVSDGVNKKTGIKTNITPADNDTSRLLPLKTGEADFTIGAASTGWLATHAIAMFAGEQWGPQPMRVIWRGGNYTNGYWTRGNSGIKTWKDIKGKRVAFVPGSPTLTVLMKGALAYADLTVEDVKPVQIASYGAACKGVIHGSVDLAISGTMTSYTVEAAASKAGIQWLDMPANDKAAWERYSKVCPWPAPGKVEAYGGKDQGIPPFTSLSYAAFLWGWENTDEDLVYDYTKGIWDSYDIYKDKHPWLPGWDHETAANFDTCHWPFHPGYIKLLKEKGVWSDKHEEFQKRQLDRETQRLSLWDTAKAKAKANKIEIGGKEYQKMWEKMLLDANLFQ